MADRTTLVETAEQIRQTLEERGPNLSARTAEDIAWLLYDHALNTPAIEQVQQTLTLTLHRDLFGADELTQLLEAVEAAASVEVAA